ncbi:hypothetical protein KQI74_04990 [Paenibacillus barcinonensis]|uniref:hypothetical protein n=1 Tax=Paenibacillus barcinonensis TaxID=198119 RepID=UPI001C11C0A3|nr:hypothetical protein [Paenibacillus barcinonensis]MBU5351625.1 hypothetical protein [Paenibacillus barcinonensis]
MEKPETVNVIMFQSILIFLFLKQDNYAQSRNGQDFNTIFIAGISQINLLKKKLHAGREFRIYVEYCHKCCLLAACSALPVISIKTEVYNEKNGKFAFIQFVISARLD